MNITPGDMCEILPGTEYPQFTGIVVEAVERWQIWGCWYWSLSGVPLSGEWSISEAYLRPLPPFPDWQKFAEPVVYKGVLIEFDSPSPLVPA